MATQTINPNSPVPTKLRNYDSSVGPTLITAVQQAAHGTITHATARANINAALATIVFDGEGPPLEWGSFVSAVNHIVNSSEAAPDKDARLRLLGVARRYLEGLLDNIREDEAEHQVARGYFMTSAQALNLNYLVSVLDEAVANQQTITFEAS